MGSKPKSIMKKIAAKDLTIHEYAQRQMLPSKLKSLVENMDLDAIGVIHAIERERNGRTVTEVIDGQHRVAALMKLDFGDWPLDVKVHKDAADNVGACRLFLELNDRSAVCTFDKFQAEVRAGVEASVAASSIIRKHNLELVRSSSSRDGLICCAAALKSVCKAYGADVLDSTLQIISQAWGKTASSLEGQIICGLAMVLGKSSGEVDGAHFSKALAKASGGAPGIIGKARALRTVRTISMTKAIAEIMVGLYNGGRRSNKLEL